MCFSSDSSELPLKIPQLLKDEYVYVDPLIVDYGTCKRIVITYGGMLVNDVSSLRLTSIVTDTTSPSKLIFMVDDMLIDAPVISKRWLQTIHDTNEPTNKMDFIIRN
ncbi:hypothetical protein GJ496_006052 [Pomphorhynchus laevis]|nr:hypothetical protein GJ496_006052 [Pomphorhynchus laevis]